MNSKIVLTDEKIKVTMDMLSDNDMINGGRIGVPADATEPNKGLVWKNLDELQNEDFDAIEDYFLNHSKQG
jgi:hypothetical protein